MKLIASNISNLTDARFFAAYMPELLVMPQASREDLSDLMLWFEQVKPWIEGPTWAIAISDQTSQQDLRKINDYGISTYIYEGSLKNYNLPSDANVYLRRSIKDLEELSDFQHPYQGMILLDCQEIKTIPTLVQGEVFIHLNTAQDYELVSAMHLTITGIALDGGDEEKVGVKSYEQLTDLLEKLF